MQDTMFATAGIATPPAATVKPPRMNSVVRVTTAFGELDEEHRIVLCLHYVERLSLEQIAEVLDDTEANVRIVYLEAVTRLSGRRRPRRKKAA